MKYFIVDAFTDRLFSGNQAGVCLPEKPLDVELMQSIAAENNLAETAFVVKNGNDYDLRWFTPKVEIDLCGHGALATAFIVRRFTDEISNVMRFHTASGVLTVEKKDDLYEMDFPARKPERITIDSVMEQAVGCRILEAWKARDILLLLEAEERVANLVPNFEVMKSMRDCFGVVVTANGNKTDFVSRFFVPNAGIDEDPLTGSTHTTLIPFWSERLNKTEMVARQLSPRGGTLFCKNEMDRVKIAGHAILYLQGEIHVD